MPKSKEEYLAEVDRIFYKNRLEGTALHRTYKEGIKNDDMRHCYIDIRLRNSKNLREELDPLVFCFLADFPEAQKPAHS